MDILQLSTLLSDVKTLKGCENADKILQVHVDQETATIFCTSQQKELILVVSSIPTLQSFRLNTGSLSYLCSSILSSDDLSLCHPAFKPGYRCNLENDDMIELHAFKDMVSIKVLFPWDKTTRIVNLYNHHGLVQTLTDEPILDLIESSISRVCRQIWLYRYGIDVDQTTQKIWSIYTVRPNEVFLAVVSKDHPQWNTRLAFCARYERLYYADESTNLWKPIPDVQLRKWIKQSILHTCNREERRLQESIISGVMELIMDKVRHDNFTSELDKNTHLFVFKECVYDSRSHEFRPVKLSDCAMVHVDWNYDATLSQECMPEVEMFFDKLFPDFGARRFVVEYILNGLLGKPASKIIVLHDGNYHLAKLIQSCFGKCYVNINKYDIPKKLAKQERLLIVDNLHRWNMKTYVRLNNGHDFRMLVTQNMDIKTPVHPIFHDQLIFIPTTDKHLYVNPLNRNSDMWKSAMFDYFRRPCRFNEAFNFKNYYLHEKDVLKKWIDSKVVPGKVYTTLGRLYRIYKSEYGALIFPNFGYWVRKIMADKGHEFRARYFLRLRGKLISVKNAFIHTATVV